MTMTMSVDDAALMAVCIAQYVRRNKGQDGEVQGMALLANLSQAWKEGFVK